MLAGAKAEETGIGTGAGERRGTTGATSAPPAVQALEAQVETTGGAAATTEAGTEEAEEVSAFLETGGVTAGAATTAGPSTTDVAASVAATRQEVAGLEAEGAAVDRPAPP